MVSGFSDPDLVNHLSSCFYVFIIFFSIGGSGGIRKKTQKYCEKIRKNTILMTRTWADCEVLWFFQKIKRVIYAKSALQIDTKKSYFVVFKKWKKCKLLYRSLSKHMFFCVFGLFLFFHIFWRFYSLSLLGVTFKKIDLRMVLFHFCKNSKNTKTQ